MASELIDDGREPLDEWEEPVHGLREPFRYRIVENAKRDRWEMEEWIGNSWRPRFGWDIPRPLVRRLTQLLAGRPEREASDAE